MSIIFVTSFINLHENRDSYRTNSEHFKHFISLAQTGIPLVLFISKEYMDFIPSYENVTVIPLHLEELWTYQEIHKINNIKIPQHRNPQKDTIPFLTLMNAKIELVKKVIDHPSFTHYSHYAWIDFSIFHIFKHISTATQILQTLAQQKINQPLLLAPGCIPYQHMCRLTIESFFDRILWRFCGGFFLGDKKTLLSFYHQYQTFFPLFTEKYGLTWEVNFWAFLEYNKLISFDWFQADHNETIIQIPSTSYK